VTTQGGMTIRIAVSGIRAQGRDTMGVRIIRVEDGDQVRDAVVLAAEATPADTTPAPPSAPPPTGAEGTEEEEPPEDRGSPTS
jgi:hypothetical protein